MLPKQAENTKPKYGNHRSMPRLHCELTIVKGSLLLSGTALWFTVLQTDLLRHPAIELQQGKGGPCK